MEKYAGEPESYVWFLFKAIYSIYIYVEGSLKWQSSEFIAIVISLAEQHFLHRHPLLVVHHSEILAPQILCHDVCWTAMIGTH